MTHFFSLSCAVRQKAYFLLVLTVFMTIMPAVQASMRPATDSAQLSMNMPLPATPWDDPEAEIIEVDFSNLDSDTYEIYLSAGDVMYMRTFDDVLAKYGDVGLQFHSNTTIRIRDNNQDSTSIMKFIKKWDPEARVNVYGVLNEAYVDYGLVQKMAAGNRDSVRVSSDGYLVAGAIAIAPEAATGVISGITLESLGAAAGVVFIEIVLPAAIVVGAVITLYLIYEGASQYLKDIRNFPQGVRNFANMVARLHWPALVASATILTVERVRTWRDEEVIEHLVDEFYDDIEKIRELEWNRPDPREPDMDPRERLFWRVLAGAVTLSQLREVRQIMEDASDNALVLWESLLERAREGQVSREDPTLDDRLRWIQQESFDRVLVGMILSNLMDVLRESPKDIFSGEPEFRLRDYLLLGQLNYTAEWNESSLITGVRHTYQLLGTDNSMFNAVVGNKHAVVYLERGDQVTAFLIERATNQVSLLFDEELVRRIIRHGFLIVEPEALQVHGGMTKTKALEILELVRDLDDRAVQTGSYGASTTSNSYVVDGVYFVKEVTSENNINGTPVDEYQRARYAFDEGVRTPEPYALLEDEEGFVLVFRFEAHTSIDKALVSGIVDPVLAEELRYHLSENWRIMHDIAGIAHGDMRFWNVGLTPQRELIWYDWGMGSLHGQSGYNQLALWDDQWFSTLDHVLEKLQNGATRWEVPPPFEADVFVQMNFQNFHQRLLLGQDIIDVWRGMTLSTTQPDGGSYMIKIGELLRQRGVPRAQIIEKVYLFYP